MYTLSTHRPQEPTMAKVTPLPPSISFDIRQLDKKPVAEITYIAPNGNKEQHTALFKLSNGNWAAGVQPNFNEGVRSAQMADGYGFDYDNQPEPDVVYPDISTA